MARLGPAEREAELSRLRALPHGVQTTTSLLDPPLTLVDGASFVAQYHDIYIRECYDFPSRRLGPTIIDGGANIGAATIWWRARWPKARVIAFEPDPQIYEVLCHNTRFLDGVELHQCALTGGGSPGFWAEGTDAGRLEPGAVADHSLVAVPTMPLSDVLRDLPRVDLLKLDIEGAETEALEAAEGQLVKVDHLFVEYHSFVDRGQTLGRLVGLLERQGFRYYLESASGRVRPFRGVPVDRGIDLQCNLFAWAGGQPRAVVRAGPLRPKERRPS
ncbi:MAG: FkbM family methyltransferase [Candidatus Dormibacteria bacterium]